MKMYTSQHWTNFILPSEFWVFIHNGRSHPILNNYENEMIQISLYTSHFLEKGAALALELLIYFKYNNHIQDRKLVLEEWNMDMMVTQWKNKSNYPIRLFKSCCTFIWNCNLFLRASESCQKSRAKNIRKSLSVLVMS